MTSRPALPESLLIAGGRLPHTLLSIQALGSHGKVEDWSLSSNSSIIMWDSLFVLHRASNSNWSASTALSQLMCSLVQRGRDPLQAA